MDVTLPNGAVIKGVPEGTPKDVIAQKAIAAGLATQEDFAQARQAPREMPVADRTQSEPYLDQVSRRMDEYSPSAILSQFLPQHQQRMGTLEEGVGATTSDVVGVGVSQAARTAGQLAFGALGTLVPTEVRNMGTQALDLIKNSEWGSEAIKALGGVMEDWEAFKKRNPQAAERIETYVDVSALFAPRPGLVNLDRKVAQATGKANLTKQEVERGAVQDMLEPEVFKVTDVVSEEGILRSKTWQPTEYESDVIDVLTTIPEVKPFRSVTYNFYKVQRHVENQRKKLDNYVKAQNKQVDVDDIKDEMLLTFDDLKKTDNFMLSSEAAQKEFAKYANFALQVLHQSDGSLRGLLDARRRFDNAVHNKDHNVLDPDVSTARSDAARAVRSVMNDYLKRNTYGDEVHHLLDQQSKSLSALDVMNNKRNKEASNMFNRAIRDLSDLNINMPTTPLAIGATAGFIIDPAVATAVAATVGGSFLGVQVARHGKSTVIKAYAQMLDAMNKGIKAAQKASRPELVERLELDRLLVIDILEQARAYEEKDESYE